MGEWVPLIVGVVAAVTTVAVAAWNGRGESAALRRLKALTEVLEQPLGSRAKANLEIARDILAVRVAKREVASSLSGRLALFGGVALASAAATVIVFTVPNLGAGETWRDEQITIGLAILVALLGLAAAAWGARKLAGRVPTEGADGPSSSQ